MVRILYDDWSIRLGENTSDQTLKHLMVMLNKRRHEYQVGISKWCTNLIIVISRVSKEQRVTRNIWDNGQICAFSSPEENHSTTNI